MTDSPSLTYTGHTDFIETRLFSGWFTRLADTRTELQQALIARPQAGDVIPGSGGVRKLRWKIEGRGKRGGLRVIYYLRSHEGHIWMLTLYAKNVAQNISAGVLKRIKEQIDGSR